MSLVKVKEYLKRYNADNRVIVLDESSASVKEAAHALNTSEGAIAKSIAVIAASIIALGIMWDKNPAAFSMALKTVGGIAAVLVGFIALMAIGSKLGDGKSMKSIGTSILIQVCSNTMKKTCLPALSQLFTLEITVLVTCFGTVTAH